MDKLFDSPLSPSFYWEDHFLQRGFRIVAGVDEAGRGPLAGPVVAAAVVILDRDFVKNLKINDSKKLSPEKRQDIFHNLTRSENKVVWGIGAASSREIDTYNILKATFIAMKRAINKLSLMPDIILVDGNRAIDNLEIMQKEVVKGDAVSYSIATASIIAKVIRDSIMAKLSCIYPRYDWGRNMGYPTKFHKTAIKKYGLTPHHRRSFHF